jgi:hypothetical protein
MDDDVEHTKLESLTNSASVKDPPFLRRAVSIFQSIKSNCVPRKKAKHVKICFCPSFGHVFGGKQRAKGKFFSNLISNGYHGQP